MYQVEFYKLSSLFMFCIFSFLLTQKTFAEEFIFERDSQYKKTGEDKFTELKANTPLVLKSGESAMIVAKNAIPLLIFSAASSNSQVKVANIDQKNLVYSYVQDELESSTNEIIDVLRKADQYVAKRDYKLALSLLNQEISKHSTISALYFLRGTTNYLLKNNVEAIADLEKGLSIDSSNAAATKLVQQLKGGNSR